MWVGGLGGLRGQGGGGQWVPMPSPVKDGVHGRPQYRKSAASMEEASIPSAGEARKSYSSQCAKEETGPAGQDSPGYRADRRLSSASSPICTPKV